ncbi:protein Tob2-like [Heteronotia binoei]|uniref:protein Tob2-like n=1 Tax=Heteronotia binoei TaxID=13085 RepID=UPI0029316DAE|nr:protein Tob2-like [Heteronotia binoei]
MYQEIKVALNFITSHLHNKLPWRRVVQFSDELEQLLKEKYEGHWYPEKPLKGSAYRCIYIGETVDPVVELAARRSGLTIEDVWANIPKELRVWIDPFEVSYQIGEEGSVEAVCLENSKGGRVAELSKEVTSGFNPDAQVFVPTGSQDNSLSSSPSSSSDQSPSPTFTTAIFAAKCASTKMKKNSRRLSWGIVHPAK